jgi:hypothetical protein
MKLTTLQNILSTKRKGSLIRLSYKTNPPLTAQAKRDGYEVEKITTTTARWGVKYSNIRRVIEQRAQKDIGVTNETDRRPWWCWKNGYQHVFKENLNGGKTYLTLSTISKGNNTRVQYKLNGVPVGTRELQGMGIIQNSYWSKDEIFVYDVNVDNIISIVSKNEIIY